MADTDTPAPETDATDDTQDPEPSTEPDLAAELAKWKAMARKNEQAAKTNASAAAKLAKIEEASKSDLEKAQAAAAEAETRAKAAEERIAKVLTRAAVETAAAKAGAIDTEAVFALLPSDAITIDGDQVSGVDAALAALQKSKPYLFGKAKPAPGSADGGHQGGKAAQWTKADLKGKSPEEINAARKAGLLVSLMSESTP